MGKPSMGNHDHQTPVNLSSILQSLYAIHSVPFPVIPAQCSKLLVSAIGILEIPETSHKPPNRIFAPSNSIFYAKYAKPIFDYLKDAGIDQGVIATIWQSAADVESPGSQAGIFFYYGDNKWLRLSNQPIQPLPAVNKPPTVKSAVSAMIIQKRECMYRIHWNKKYPLGKSNDFSLPLRVRKYFHEKFQTLKHNIADGRLHRYLESVLGVYCPIPAGAMEQLQSMSPTDVMRNCGSYHTNPENVFRVLLKLFTHFLPFENLLEWKPIIKEYVCDMTSRFDFLNFKNIKTRCIEWKFFVFKKFIIPIISYMFYVTETAADTVCYYRRPVWDLMVTKASLGLIEILGLGRVGADTIGTASAKVRWIPKPNGGLRPIVVQPKILKDKSKRLVRFLNSLRATPIGREKMGSSIFSRDECFDRLEKFQRSDPIHFFTVDIQNCFESIPFLALERALAAFANDAISFSSVMVSSGKFGSARMRTRPLVFIRSNLDNLIAQISSPGTRPIIISASTFSEERKTYGQVRAEIMQIVKSSMYLLNTRGSTTWVDAWKVSDRGLAQGNGFSVLLVSIFYGFIDTIGKWSTNTIMIRLIDDILCLSTNGEEIKKIYEKIFFENFYGQINIAKSHISWETGCGDVISWAGFTFRPRNRKLNISVDAPIVTGRPRKHNSLEMYFNLSLGRSIAHQCLPGLFRSSINSTECLNENAYRAGSFSGRRIKCFLKSRYIHRTDPAIFAKSFTQFMLRRFRNQPPNLVRQFFTGLEHSLV